MLDSGRRWDERARDLERGVDADLVKANRKRYQISSLLMALGVGMIPLALWPPAQPAIPEAFRWIGAAIAAAGMIGLRWARAENEFLQRPDPEKPPRLDQ